MSISRHRLGAALPGRTPPQLGAQPQNTARPLSRSKFKNVRVEVDGIEFPSKKQAKRYSELKLLERAGEIRDLRLEVTYSLIVSGQLVCKYRSDFDYITESGQPITEDTKGFRTPLYRLKAKLFKAIYGREILET